MKAFAVILLCAFAAVQGRSAAVQSTRAAAALGENPWFVHLRYAVSTSGLLSTCAGSLIDNRWILTSASCLTDVRFIWARYGVVRVISPSLVTEASLVTAHPEYNAETGANDIGLININRFVHSTENIGTVALASSSDVPSSGKLCAFGEENSAPGETLSCFDVTLSAEDDGFIAASSDEGSVTQFDIGAAVVSDGVQVGLVVRAEDGGASVLGVSSYVEWIEEVTGVDLRRTIVPEIVKPDVVKFVN